MAVSVLTFVVPGRPRSKARARRGRAGRWYTPKGTKDYERSVAAHALYMRQQTPHPWPQTTGAFRIQASLYFVDGPIPDFDNVLKSLMDGLQGILWQNDRQVVGGRVEIRRVGAAKEQRAEIIVTQEAEA